MSKTEGSARRKSSMEHKFSAEMEIIKDVTTMNHSMPSYLDPNIEKDPEPQMSKFADQNVIIGKKGGLAIDKNLVETYKTICVVCGVDFKSRSNLHAHLTEHIHMMGKVDNYLKVPIYECKLCQAELNCSSVLRHRCFVKHQNELQNVEQFIDARGSPLVCIFCRGRILPSRAHLIAHILSAHSPNRNPFRCIFCHSKFQSDSLIMQEMHVFSHHVPELVFLNRKAYFKEIMTLSNSIVDPTAPFLCLYNGKKMESASWMDAVPETADNGDINMINISSAGQGLCAASFKTLAEYTAHLYCNHTAVPPENEMSNNLNEEELKHLEQIQRRIPGPTIRQLMRGLSSVGDQKDKKRKAHKKLSKGTCRVCLQDYGHEESLKKHMTIFHIPEAQKRVQHLVKTGELVKKLDIDRLCTECFKIYPSVYELQIHLMVAHGGKSWCSCGICGQEFCETDLTLPAHLTIGKQIDVDDENQSNVVIVGNAPPTYEKSTKAIFDFSCSQEQPEPEKINESLIDNLHEPYSSPMPILTMCRILDTHEEKHCAELYTSLNRNFLPESLLTQLLKSRGQQAYQVASWLMNAYLQPAHLELKPFRYDDPNDMKKKKNVVKLKLGFDPLPKEGLDDSLMYLQGLIVRSAISKSSSDEGLSKPLATATKRDSIRSRGDRPDVEIARKNSHETPSQLPTKLAKLFNQLGERNATMQAELEFADTL